MPIVGKIEFADIRDHGVGIDEIRIRLRDAMLARRPPRISTASVYIASQVSFSRTMGNLLHSVILRHQDRGPGEELKLHGLIRFRAEAMKVCKHIGDLSCKIPLPF